MEWPKPKFSNEPTLRDLKSAGQNSNGSSFSSWKSPKLDVLTPFDRTRMPALLLYTLSGQGGENFMRISQKRCEED